MTLIQDLTTIIAGTGTTGDTTILTFTTNIMGDGTLIIIGIITIMFLGIMLDQRLNLKQDQKTLLQEQDLNLGNQLKELE